MAGATCQCEAFDSGSPRRRTAFAGVATAAGTTQELGMDVGVFSGRGARVEAAAA